MIKVDLESLTINNPEFSLEHLENGKIVLSYNKEKYLFEADNSLCSNRTALASFYNIKPNRFEKIYQKFTQQETSLINVLDKLL